MSDSERKARRRWINLGEMIALGALVVSALGLWITWKSDNQDKATRVVEQRQAIPLTLRGKVEDDGSALDISPVEASHALESLTITIAGTPPIEIGSDGRLSASDVETALKKREAEPKGPHSVAVKIDARYVEMGKDRHATSTYTLRYRWDRGGLFGGRSLKLTGLTRG